MTDGKSPTEWAGEAMPVERGHASHAAQAWRGGRGRLSEGPQSGQRRALRADPLLTAHTVAPEPGAQPAARSRRCLPAVGERPGTQR